MKRQKRRGVVTLADTLTRQYTASHLMTVTSNSTNNLFLLLIICCDEKIMYKNKQKIFFCAFYNTFTECALDLFEFVLAPVVGILNMSGCFAGSTSGR